MVIVMPEEHLALRFLQNEIIRNKDDSHGTTFLDEVLSGLDNVQEKSQTLTVTMPLFKVSGKLSVKEFLKSVSIQSKCSTNSVRIQSK